METENTNNVDTDANIEGVLVVKKHPKRVLLGTGVALLVIDRVSEMLGIDLTPYIEPLKTLLGVG